MDDFLSTYHRLLTHAGRIGRCPMWITDPGLSLLDPPADRERILAEIDAREAGAVLADRWPGGCSCGNERLDPFHDGFPGLVPRAPAGREEAIWHAAGVVDGESSAEPALVRATRPADVPALMGWMGPWNSWQDNVGMSAVLRSWEERFGALLFAIDSATLELAVAAPPQTEKECLQVAAEHIAFCWDACDTYTGQITTDTLGEYARRLEGAPQWRFWWD